MSIQLSRPNARFSGAHQAERAARSRLTADVLLRSHGVCLRVVELVPIEEQKSEIQPPDECLRRQANRKVQLLPITPAPSLRLRFQVLLLIIHRLQPVAKCG